MSNVTFKGNPVKVEGTEVNVGDKAPDFTVTRVPWTPVTFSEAAAGKTVLLSVTPSVDTGVCDIQMRALNTKAASLGDNVLIWNLSVDTPFALKRYCGDKGIENVEALSDFKEKEFGRKYGVYMSEMGLLARAMFVIDSEGTLRYKEIVPEMTHEPNYDAALKALTEAVG